MDKGKELRASLAVMGAAAGTGYASGRELVLFFAQLGRASWVGIGFAAAVFGLLMALLCRWAGTSGATGFAGACRHLLGPRAGGVAGAMHVLLMALTAAMTLRGAGEIGALTLPVRNGFLWGAGIALALALLVNLARLQPLPWMGGAALATGVLFYGALAADPRPVRVYLPGDTQLALEGSLPAAALLALVYGALNAGMAASIALRFSRGGARPGRLGLLCGGALAMVLLCANAAIARGGRQLLAQALPTVVLAARWRLAGFWLSAAFTYLCAASTLAAALGGLAEQLRR